MKKNKEITRTQWEKKYGNYYLDNYDSWKDFVKKSKEAFGNDWVKKLTYKTNLNNKTK